MKHQNCLTIYGRNPVIEALQEAVTDPNAIKPLKLFLDQQARGGQIQDMLALCRQLGIEVKRMSALELSRISRNGNQDQGVALDLLAPKYQSLQSALKEDLSKINQPIFLFDGITTPANVGMLIRSLMASDVYAMVLPRKGCSEINPLVIKSSSGLALHAPIWHHSDAVSAVEQLKANGFSIYGLSGLASLGKESLYGQKLTQRAVWVLGNESNGISPAVEALVDRWYYMEMFQQVESLNVAVAGAVVAFELMRQRIHR